MSASKESCNKSTKLKGSSMMEILLVSAAILIIGGLSLGGLSAGKKRVDKDIAYTQILELANSVNGVIAQNIELTNKYTKNSDVKLKKRLQGMNDEMNLKKVEGDTLTECTLYETNLLDPWKEPYLIAVSFRDSAYTGKTGEDVHGKGYLLKETTLADGAISISKGAELKDIKKSDKELRVFIVSCGPTADREITLKLMNNFRNTDKSLVESRKTVVWGVLECVNSKISIRTGQNDQDSLTVDLARFGIQH